MRTYTKIKQPSFNGAVLLMCEDESGNVTYGIAKLSGTGFEKSPFKDTEQKLALRVNVWFSNIDGAINYAEHRFTKR